MPQISNLTCAGNETPIEIGTAAMISWKNRCVHALRIDGGFWVPELCTAIRPGESPTPLSLQDICGSADYAFAPISDIDVFISHVPATIRRLIGHINKRASSKCVAKSDDEVVSKKAKSHQKLHKVAASPSLPLQDFIEFDVAEPTPKTPLQSNITPTLDETVGCFLCPAKTTNLGHCDNPSCTMLAVGLCHPCLALSCTFGHVQQRTTPGGLPPMWQPNTAKSTMMVPRTPNETPGKCVMCHKVEMNITECPNVLCEIYGYGAMCNKCYSAGCQVSHIPKEAPPPPLTSPPMSTFFHASVSPSPKKPPTLFLPKTPIVKSDTQMRSQSVVNKFDMHKASQSDVSNSITSQVSPLAKHPKKREPLNTSSDPVTPPESSAQAFGTIIQVLGTLVKTVEALASSVRQASSSPAPVMRQASASAARFDARMAENRCYVCGSLDHWVKDCPKGKQNGN